MHGWGNHSGESGHGLSNILTLHNWLNECLSTNLSEQLKHYYTATVYAGLSTKMLVSPVLAYIYCMWVMKQPYNCLLH